MTSTNGCALLVLKKKFLVEELENSDFLNFAELYSTKNELIFPKKDEEGNKFKWTEIRWLRYAKGKDKKISFKTSLNEAKSFAS